MTTATGTAAPATVKQTSYLTSLVSARDPENIEVMLVKGLLESNALDVKLASKCIDAMLKLKPKTKAAPAPVPAPVPLVVPRADNEVKVGLYDTMPGYPADEIKSGRYVLVYKNAKGYLKAKRMYKSWDTKSGWSWKGIGLYGIKSWVSKGKAVPVDAESAADLGKKYGFCVYCGHLLTTDESLKAGYGPTCASTYNLPWGN